MKVSKIILQIGFIFTICIVLFPTAVRAQVCNLTNNNVKYFGYYGLTDPVMLQEVINMDNSNILMTSGWGGASYYPNYKGKFIIDLMTGMLGSESKLDSDWETVGIDRLKYYVNLYNNRVYAFYIDEPYFNNISREDYRAVTQKLREVFPNINIMAIEAFTPILNHQIPSDYYEYVTDLGFDYYFTHYDSDNNSGWNKYMEIYHALEPYFSNKRIWLIPDGHTPVINPQYNRWPDAFERYVCLANSDSRIYGIINYIYKTYPQYTELHDIIDPSGVHYNSAFRSRHIEIGRQIIDTKLTIDPVRKSYDLNNDGLVNIFDYNLLIRASIGLTLTLNIQDFINAITP